MRILAIGMERCSEEGDLMRIRYCVVLALLLPILSACPVPVGSNANTQIEIQTGLDIGDRQEFNSTLDYRLSSGKLRGLWLRGRFAWGPTRLPPEGGR